MRRRERKNGRRSRRGLKHATRFGRYVPWEPAELPDEARAYWPSKSDWPSMQEVDAFVRGTRKKPNVRLNVLTGLRRYAEPGPAQMLIAVASVIISIAAFAIGAAGSFPGFPVWIIVSVGAIYVAMVIYGIGFALDVDERRKTALVWLRAIEAAI